MLSQSDKAQLFRALTHEARKNRECVVCGFPLRHGTGRLPVKCQRAECLLEYNAMYRRLMVPYERVAVSKKRKLTSAQVLAVREMRREVPPERVAAMFGISERYVRLLRERPELRRDSYVVAK